MPKKPTTHHEFRFGGFRLNVEAAALISRGHPIPLPHKQAELLVCLIKGKGSVVKRDDIVRDVWGSTSKNNLHKNIEGLRRALQDQKEPHRYIVTTHGEGYKFIAPVQVHRVQAGSWANAIRSIHSEPLPGAELTRYRVEPANREDVVWAAGIAARVYSGDDIIPKDLMIEWYKKNPNGFFCVKSVDGRRFGNLDILPLRPSTLDHFVRGEIIERNITGDSLYGPDDSQEIRHLYIESFVSVISDKDKPLKPNALAVAHVLSQASQMFKLLGSPRRLQRIYAIAASDGGRRLLNQLGFRALPNRSRLDGHTLYSVPSKVLTKRLAANFLPDGTDKFGLAKQMADEADRERGL